MSYTQLTLVERFRIFHMRVVGYRGSGPGHPLVDGVSTEKGSLWRAQRADFRFHCYPRARR